MAESKRGWVRLLQAGWLKPLIFLVFLTVAWDLVIRLFHIPPYQIPKPTNNNKTQKTKKKHKQTPTQNKPQQKKKKKIKKKPSNALSKKRG